MLRVIFVMCVFNPELENILFEGTWGKKASSYFLLALTAETAVLVYYSINWTNPFSQMIFHVQT